MLGPLMGNTGGLPMAKKARKKASKKSSKKAGKKSAAKRTKTKVSKARKARKPAAKKASAKKSKATRPTKRARKSKPKTFGQRVASAISVVSDTITGTDKLRNKMEPPATSETE
jgi:hypothetical protein